MFNCFSWRTFWFHTTSCNYLFNFLGPRSRVIFMSKHPPKTWKTPIRLTLLSSLTNEKPRNFCIKLRWLQISLVYGLCLTVIWGICIGQVRLGQIKAANYCVPPYTIMLSITRAWEGNLDFKRILFYFWKSNFLFKFHQTGGESLRAPFG